MEDNIRRVKGKYKIALNSSGFYEIIQMYSSLDGKQHMLVGTALSYDEAKVNIMNRYNSGILQYELIDNIEYYYVVDNIL